MSQHRMPNFGAVDGQPIGSGRARPALSNPVGTRISAASGSTHISKMEIAASRTNVIVPEVLRRGNYKRWSTLMRYYLQGQDLWDIVEPSQLPAGGNKSSEWKKKNALALHAIMISCGEEMFRKIKEMDSAKGVWDKLADMNKPPVVHKKTVDMNKPLESGRGPGNLESRYKILTGAISNGGWWKVESFFKKNEENPNAISARISENGYTALHFAVYNRKGEILNSLLQLKPSPGDIKIQDNFGNTALSIAARFGVGKSIAQRLVRADRNLLTIPDNEGKIPVELACSTNDEDMIRYLYRETPLGSLEGDRAFYILQQCITRKMFDIVFDLLSHFPALASQSCPSDPISLILTLAQTPPPFYGRSNLSFWNWWICNCIGVKAYLIKEDEHRSCVGKIIDFFQSCGEMVQYCFQSCGKTIQEFFLTSLKDFRVLAVAIPLSIPLILGKLILVVLRMLVSVFSRFFGTHLYYLRLMDEYAREVIRLICHPLSKLYQNQFVESKAVEAAFQAIKNNISDIVQIIAEANPNILWSSTDPEDSSRKIFDCAIAYRNERVARFLYEFAKKQEITVFTIDEDGNNTLHLAAKLPPRYHFGVLPEFAALLLQDELRWFKAVKKIVPQSYIGLKNEDNETPGEVFVREHMDLRKDADEWAKKTAESSTIIGALVITIMFAVAFSVPGGTDQSAGFPIFLHKTPVSFMVFMVSDAISLFTASSSVIIFLGILTSYHATKRSLKSLLLIIGLTSLLISIATMTIAFCAALFITLQGRLQVVIPITLLAGIPITCFVWLQFPLLYMIFELTFGRNIFPEKETSWMIRMKNMFF